MAAETLSSVAGSARTGRRPPRPRRVLAMTKARMTGWMGGGEEGGLSRAGEEGVIHGVRRQVIYISGSSGLGLIVIYKRWSFHSDWNYTRSKPTPHAW